MCEKLTMPISGATYSLLSADVPELKSFLWRLAIQRWQMNYLFFILEESRASPKGGNTGSPYVAAATQVDSIP